MVNKKIVLGKYIWQTKHKATIFAANFWKKKIHNI